MADGSSCIVGGGPAGMMLGFLLARGGVSVTVLASGFACRETRTIATKRAAMISG